MATTKLRIDFSAGTLDVEGEEAFVRGVYEDFKGRLSQLSPIEPSKKSRVSAGSAAGIKKGSSKASKGGTKRKDSYSFVKDLDLSAKNGRPALKAFFAEKVPATALEKNTVFIYYLERLAKIGGITINHVYTCYKHVGVPVPGALRQSLLDTAHLKGWIDTKSLDDISLAIHGENYVEHDLPKKVTAAAK